MRLDKLLRIEAQLRTEAFNDGPALRWDAHTAVMHAIACERERTRLTWSARAALLLAFACESDRAELTQQRDEARRQHANAVRLLDEARAHVNPSSAAAYERGRQAGLRERAAARRPREAARERRA